MLRAAIDHFENAMELENLRKSAQSYSEIYSEDENLEDLTETAIHGWPE